MKEYIVVYYHGGRETYWTGWYFTPNKEDVKTYTIDELPRNLSNKSLYKIGNDPPLSWKYVSTCGDMCYIEEINNGQKE